MDRAAVRLHCNGMARTDYRVRGRSAARVAAVLILLVPALVWAGTGKAIQWDHFSDKVLKAAQSSGQPFVVTFGAEWCEPCKEMGSRTYTDPDVVKAGRGVRFIAVDMTRRDSTTAALLKAFRVPGAPTTIFYGTDGRERFRRIGFIPPKDYAQFLRDSRRSTKL